jgi:hypothetical protein
MEVVYMKKYLIDDEDHRMLERMKDVHLSMDSILSDLYARTMYPEEDERIKRIELARREFVTALCIFFAESSMDYDEWIKDNNVQTKKKET